MCLRRAAYLAAAVILAVTVSYHDVGGHARAALLEHGDHIGRCQVPATGIVIHLHATYRCNMVVRREVSRPVVYEHHAVEVVRTTPTIFAACTRYGPYSKDLQLFLRMLSFGKNTSGHSFI